MAVLSRRQVASFLQERRQAMAETRFKPENYHEIHRVLGVRFAPDLTRVVSQQRANAASAYLKRLHHDVEKSKGGFYNQLHALPLQIRPVKIHTEDTRTYRSVLVPKFKLPPLLEDGPIQGHVRVSPKTVSPKSVTPGSALPPLVSHNGSNYVTHNSFSPHTSTHVHVLYKQVGGSITPRKGASSVVSSAVSVHAAPSSNDPKSRRSSVQFYGAPKLESPQEQVTPRSPEDSRSETSSSVEESPQPFSYLKLTTGQTPQPHIKKRLFVNLMPRNEHQHPGPVFKPKVKPKMESSPIGHLVSRRNRNGIPPKVAAALTSGVSPAVAVYKFVLPSNLAETYNSLPAEQPKTIMMGSRSRFPSISSQAAADNQLLSVTSVRPFHVVRAAV